MGARVLTVSTLRCSAVSIHAPAMGARRACSQSIGPESFNPRTRQGGEVQSLKRLTAQMFQSTHPRWVRGPAFDHNVDNMVFQSTHPRWVRVQTAQQTAMPELVSIHAPAMGARLSLLY